MVFCACETEFKTEAFFFVPSAKSFEVGIDPVQFVG